MNARVIRSAQWFGVAAVGVYISLRGPLHRPLFSERNRIKCFVIPLGFGWRAVIRATPATPLPTRPDPSLVDEWEMR